MSSERTTVHTDTLTCDGCGFETKQVSSITSPGFKWTGWAWLVERDRGSEEHYHADLCPECLAAVRAFLEARRAASYHRAHAEKERPRA